ncbi:Uncharacterized protein Adt_19924 [Abeliophyllum distichum]|uniref:Transposase MuDR plant domain-containing protein n=1 Tax=Abeliophyllum distichum TaxID=126358 RepID=A0ABD1SUA2_9LAMI
MNHTEGGLGTDVCGVRDKEDSVQNNGVGVGVEDGVLRYYDEEVSNLNDDDNLATNYNWSPVTTDLNMEFGSAEDEMFDDLWSLASDDDDSMKFTDNFFLKKAILKHNVKRGREVKYKKDDKLRLQAVCVHDDCSWVLYARFHKTTNTFIIRTMALDHNCAMTFKNKHVDANFLAEKYMTTFKHNPDWRSNGFMDAVKTNCASTV